MLKMHRSPRGRKHKNRKLLTNISVTISEVLNHSSEWNFIQDLEENQYLLNILKPLQFLNFEEKTLGYYKNCTSKYVVSK